MEVLITGGNGLLGRHLVTALRNRGETVRVLMLPGDNGAWLQDRGVAVYEGDVRRPETLTEPIRGVGAVLHLAGMSGVWEPVEAYRAVNLTGTVNVCKEALAARVRKIVHVSSWTVYGIGLGKSAREDFLLRPFDDPSSITKASGDLAVQRMITDDDLPAVILRPGAFIGPGDHLHFGRIADRLLAREAVVIGPGDNALPFVYVDDVVRGVLLALDDQNAVGQAYNISHDQPLTQQQLLDAVAEDIGATSPRVHIPCNVLYIAALAAERLALASGTKPALTRLGVQLFGTDNRHAIDKARRQLGYRPETPLRDAVRLTAAWYLRQRADRAQVGGGLAEAPMQRLVRQSLRFRQASHDICAVRIPVGGRANDRVGARSVRSLMALVAQRHKMIKPVGGKQRRLPPYVRYNVGLLYDAHPACPTIPVQACCLGVRHTRSVIGVEYYVERHARRSQDGHPPTAGEEQQGQDHGWVVQEPCCRVCRRMRTVERSRRRGGA